MSNEENNQNKLNKPKVEFFKQNNNNLESNDSNKNENKSTEEVKKKIDFFPKINSPLEEKEIKSPTTNQSSNFFPSNKEIKSQSAKPVQKQPLFSQEIINKEKENQLQINNNNNNNNNNENNEKNSLLMNKKNNETKNFLDLNNENEILNDFELINNNEKNKSQSQLNENNKETNNLMFSNIKNKNLQSFLNQENNMNILLNENKNNNSLIPDSNKNEEIKNESSESKKTPENPNKKIDESKENNNKKEENENKLFFEDINKIEISKIKSSDNIKLNILKEKNLPNYNKYEKSKCIEYYKEIILNNLPDIDGIESNLKKLFKENKISKFFIRNEFWKILLNFYPKKMEDNKNLLIRDYFNKISEKRNLYKINLKKSQNIKLFFQTIDMKHLIGIDVDRTNQEEQLFREESIKKIQNNILFLWSKENFSYRQGMNEILAMLITIYYPYYFKVEKKITNFEENIFEKENYAQIIYEYFYDEDEFESDLYYLYSSIMDKLKIFYDDLYQEDNKTYLIYKCHDIIYNKLKIVDEQLFNFFQQIGIDIEIILQRWIKCIFSREFSIQNVIIIWDYYFIQLNQNFNTQFFDFFCIAMLVNVKDKIFGGNQSECFQILFKYPQIENIFNLIQIESNLEKEYKKREKNEKKINIKNFFSENKEKNLFVNIEEKNNKIKNNITLVPPEKPNELKIYDKVNIEQEKKNKLNDLKTIKFIFEKYKNNFTNEDQKIFNESLERLEKNI